MGEALKEQIMELVFSELRKAEEKFRGFPIDAIHGAAIVGEEAGELLQAALDWNYGRYGNKACMKREACQAAAMALRFLFNLEYMERQEVYQRMDSEKGEEGMAKYRTKSTIGARQMKEKLKEGDVLEGDSICCAQCCEIIPVGAVAYWCECEVPFCDEKCFEYYHEK